MVESDWTVHFASRIDIYNGYIKTSESLVNLIPEYEIAQHIHFVMTKETAGFWRDVGKFGLLLIDRMIIYKKSLKMKC